MKKFLIFSLLIILSGCNSHFLNKEPSYKDKLIEAGFNEDIVNILNDYSNESLDLILNNVDKVNELINKKSLYDEDYIVDYINSSLDIDSFIYVKDNNKDLNTFILFYKDKYFMLKNADLYFKYNSQFESTRDLIEYVNTEAYKTPYEEYVETDTSKGIYMIASKIYYLDKYEPSNLVQVENNYYLSNPPYLNKEAYSAYKKMANAARSEDIYFYISTAYRSYTYQETLYNNYLLSDPQEVVDTYSSRPGFSDHQIGLSCDIRTKDKAFDNFTGTTEEKWLNQNAYKYGFIRRYPEGKENITGYIPESWHYRYVGISAAKEIYENNITFDEYYAYYID